LKNYSCQLIAGKNVVSREKTLIIADLRGFSQKAETFNFSIFQKWEENKGPLFEINISF